MQGKFQVKRYHDDFRYEQKRKNKPLSAEQKSGGFRCSHCRQWVVINHIMGTANRNHCNMCLWSRHVDNDKGDRRSECRGGMEPIGLTLKHEGFGRVGELMLVHECRSCSKLSINRIARDDYDGEILNIFEQSRKIDQSQLTHMAREGIELLDEADEICRQLYGA
jgi:hypothetical protein